MTIAALVVFAVAVVVLTPRGEGVNFLIVVPMLPLVALGLPWSVLSMHAAANDLVSGDAAFWGLYIAPALLNLAVHALLQRLRSLKGGADQRLTGGSEPPRT